MIRTVTLGLILTVGCLWSSAAHAADADVVADGQEALNRVKKEKYDLLIMDVHMPRLEGPQALEAIRLIPNGKDLGVIFLTSEKMMSTFTRVFELGAVGFIPKPFPASKLINEVNAFFAAKNGPKP